MLLDSRNYRNTYDIDCPHCGKSISIDLNGESVVINPELEGEDFFAFTGICPSAGCKKSIVILAKGVSKEGAHGRRYLATENWRFVEPKTIARKPVSSEVPDKYAEDYKEAALVLSDSPKASAALSRRCLQSLIRDMGEVKPSVLSKEIDEIVNAEVLPSHLSEALHAVREIGNLAAHPTKDNHTGDIVGVEPGEAEWLLDVLEGLFDFYFVEPAKMASRKASLNTKLKAAGRKPIE